MSRKVKIGTEFGYRFTTTDYLDDVSGNYYSKDKLKQYKGALSAAMSDPSTGANPSWTSEGEQRGNPTYKDGYLSFMVKVTYMPKKDTEALGQVVQAANILLINRKNDQNLVTSSFPIFVTLGKLYKRYATQKHSSIFHSGVSRLDYLCPAKRGICF